LDITGKKAPPATPKQGLWSTRGMMTTTVVFWIALNTLIISGFEYKLHSYVSLSVGDIISIILLNSCMAAFAVYATVNTRSFLRDKYYIGDDTRLSKAKDAISAIFCLPLTVAQMGRHTTSYEEYDGAYCNNTGVGARRNRDGIV
jgi:hypothetical protein